MIEWYTKAGTARCDDTLSLVASACIHEGFAVSRVGLEVVQCNSTGIQESLIIVHVRHKWWARKLCPYRCWTVSERLHGHVLAIVDHPDDPSINTRVNVIDECKDAKPWIKL